MSLDLFISFISFHERVEKGLDSRHHVHGMVLQLKNKICWCCVCFFIAMTALASKNNTVLATALRSGVESSKRPVDLLTRVT